MHRIATVAALGLTLSIAPAALAQTIDGRVDFRNDHSPRNTPTGSSYTVTHPGTYEFQVLFGLFDAQGFTNRGMFNFIGDISLNDPLGTSTMAPLSGGARRSPYDGNGLGADGSPGNSTTFDAFRGFNPGTFTGDMYIQVPWAYGDPMPSMLDAFYPSPYDRHVAGSGSGTDEYFPGYRFTVTVPDLASRTITVDLSATTQAVSLFFPIETVAPTPTSDGSVTFLPAGFVADNDVQATLTIDVVTPLPTPGSVVLLGLGAVFAHRRRRTA